MLWWLSRDGSYVWHCLDRENIVLCLVTIMEFAGGRYLTLLSLKEVLYRFLKLRSKRLLFHAGQEQEQELLR